MPNQQVPQGTLNRLRASVVYEDFAELNVTASYLDKQAVGISFQGDAGVLLPTLTGGVTSPEPYQIAIVTIHLLRSQALSDAYKTQFENDTSMGSVNVIPDSNTLENYQLENCILMKVDDQEFSGTTTGFVVRLAGIYYVNAALFAGS
jgi:hypothetical protein